MMGEKTISLDTDRVRHYGKVTGTTSTTVQTVRYTTLKILTMCGS